MEEAGAVAVAGKLSGEKGIAAWSRQRMLHFSCQIAHPGAGNPSLVFMCKLSSNVVSSLCPAPGEGFWGGVILVGAESSEGGIWREWMPGSVDAEELA